MFKKFDFPKERYLSLGVSIYKTNKIKMQSPMALLEYPHPSVLFRTPRAIVEPKSLKLSWNPFRCFRTRFVVFEPVSSSSHPFFCLQTCSLSSFETVQPPLLILAIRASRLVSLVFASLYRCPHCLLCQATSSSEEEHWSSRPRKERGGCGRSALGRALVNLCRRCIT